MTLLLISLENQSERVIIFTFFTTTSSNLIASVPVYFAFSLVATDKLNGFYLYILSPILFSSPQENASVTVPLSSCSIYFAVIFIIMWRCHQYNHKNLPFQHSFIISSLHVAYTPSLLSFHLFLESTIHGFVINTPLKSASLGPLHDAESNVHPWFTWGKYSLNS